MFKPKCKLPRAATIAISLAVSILLIGASLASERPALPIDINSESGRYDVRSGAYHLSGNVRIKRGDLLVRADEARSFSGPDGQVERIELYGNPTTWSDVLEDGSAVEGQSLEITYDFTRNIITMQGEALIRNVQGAFSGSKLVYDLDSEDLVGDGGVNLVIEPDAGERARRQITEPPEESEN